MKRILIILLILIGLLIGGSYFYFLKTLVPGEVPAKVQSAEDIIATSGTIAIASVNMNFVRRIDKMFNTEKDPSPLVIPATNADENFFNRLNKQGVDLFSETNYALATINVSKKIPAYTVVLFGKFSGNKLKQAIKKEYLVDESSNGYWLLTKNSEQKKNNDPCAVESTVKKSPPQTQALQIQKDRIILSSKEFMPVLLKRFANKARAEVSLVKWREFKKDKVLAAALMSPEEAKKGAVDLPSALLLGALSSQPLKDVYAGAVISLLPSPGFTFIIDAHSKQTAWPLEVKTKYDGWFNEAMDDLSEMPTLKALVKTLSVQAEGNILHLKTIANQKTLENIQKIPSEFMQMAFSGVFDSDETSKAGNEEQIVKASEVEKFTRKFNFSKIKPFESKNSFHKPDYVVGPFAVRLRKIGLLDIDDSIIQLEINAEGLGFENLSSELMHRSDKSPAASIFISDVVDKDGNNLLREEQCGKTRNGIAVALSTSRDKQYVNNQWVTKSIKVSGDRSVRLKQNVALSQVDKINGKIVVRAGTRTKVKVLQPPFKKKTIETDKVRMYFKKGNLKTLRYEISGDLSYIMAVRAKNAKGQYLADAGSSSTSNKNGKIISKKFKGKIASVEVVFAEKMESKEYPFVIDKIVPRYGEPAKGVQRVMTSTFKKTFLRKHAKTKFKDICKNKQKVTLGEFIVCLNKFGERWGQATGAEFDVIAPYDEALQNDLSAGMLSIDSVTTDSGEEVIFAKNEKFGFDYKFDTNYNNKNNNWEITNRRLQASYIKIFSNNEELKNKKIRKIKGTLTIRLGNGIKYIELSADELGIVKKSKNGIIANVSAFEDWHTYIDIQGPVDKVMRFMPLAKDGTILKTDNDRLYEKKYNTWGMSKADKEKIKLLPKKWQGMITIYGKPDIIRVYYADKFETIKRKFQIPIK